jgi:MFS family permease
MSPTERIRKRAEQHFHPKTVNFWCHLIEGTFAVVGLQFASDLEVLPLLVRRLGGSNTIVGVVQAALTFAVAAPLLLAPWVEAAVKRKRNVLVLGVFMRVPMLLVGLALLAYGQSLPGLCLVLVSGSLLVRKFAGALLNPMWIDLLAETIPPGKQGRLMGSRTFLGALFGLPAAVLAGWIIGRFAFPGNYAMVYIIAFAFMAVSWLVFALVDDVPDDVPERERQAITDYYGDLGGALARDGDYRNFLLTQMFRHAAFSGVVFYPIVAANFHGMSAGVVVSGLMIGRRAGRMIGPVIGTWISERFGEKRAVQFGNTVAACSALIAAAAPRGYGWAIIGAAFIWSIGGTSRHVGSQSIALKLYPRGRRVGYQSLRMVGVALTGLAVSPAMGYLMDLPVERAHVLTFSLVAALNLAGCLPIQFCRVPNEKEIAERDGTAAPDEAEDRPDDAPTRPDQPES